MLQDLKVAALLCFQLHLEASHVLKYSEKEFMDTLDWKPFSQPPGEE